MAFEQSLVKQTKTYHVIPVEVVGSLVAIFGHSRDCVAVLMVTNIAVESDFVKVSSYLVVPMLIYNGLKVLSVGHVDQTVQRGEGWQWHLSKLIITQVMKQPQIITHFTPVVVTGGVPALHDLVAGLKDKDVEPDAEVGGDHVHEAEARDELALVDVHLLVEEDEVHLDEDEKHLLGRASTIVHLFRHLVMIEQ